MFSGCSSLKELDIINFNINKVIDIFGMFSGCSPLLINKIKEQIKNIPNEAFIN